MLSKMINKTSKTLIIIFIAITLFIYSFAEENIINNEVISQENTTNTVKQLTLQEQKNQVQEHLVEAQEKLTYVENELTTNLIQIQKLEEKIEGYQRQYDEINSQFEDLQQKVLYAESVLSEVQQEYDKKDELMRNRLVELYKKGSINYLDVLLSSNDFFEFVSNFYIMEQITEYDSETLSEINEKKLQIEKITNELKDNKAKMKIAKAQAETQAVILTNTKTILENEKESLDETEKRILAEIDAYKRQEQELSDMITKAIYASTYELQYSGGRMIWPTLSSAYITSPFGTRLHPIQGIIKNHNGIDIGGKTGDPVYAAQDGIVIYSDWMSGYGYTTMVDHGLDENGVKIVTLYGHGSKLLKQVGDVVKQGDTIMEEGSTGNSTGPHVHFEVRENGVAVDPKDYLSS